MDRQTDERWTKSDQKRSFELSAQVIYKFSYNNKQNVHV